MLARVGEDNFHRAGKEKKRGKTLAPSRSGSGQIEVSRHLVAHLSISKFGHSTFKGNYQHHRLEGLGLFSGILIHKFVRELSLPCPLV